MQMVADDPTKDFTCLSAARSAHDSARVGDLLARSREKLYLATADSVKEVAERAVLAEDAEG